MEVSYFHCLVLQSISYRLILISHTADGDIALSFQDALILGELSTKYCMDDLLSKVLAPLRLMYGANTLEEYLVSSNLVLKSRLNAGDHIAVVNLARRLHLPELLPSAFFRAATVLTIGEIINGWTRRVDEAAESA